MKAGQREGAARLPSFETVRYREPRREGFEGRGASRPLKVELRALMIQERREWGPEQKIQRSTTVRKEVPVYDWQETQEPGGKLIAKLCGTKVLVCSARDDAPAAWSWEVRFADGQVQVGYADDPDLALEKGKKVAERFLP